MMLIGETRLVESRVFSLWAIQVNGCIASSIWQSVLLTKLNLRGVFSSFDKLANRYLGFQQFVSSLICIR